MPEQQDDLAAEAEIKALHLRYCRAADRLDADLFRSCFHTDAEFDFPAYKGPVEGFIDMAWDTLAGFVVTRHFTGNQLVEIKGDRAWAEHYTVASHRIAASDGGPLRDYVAHLRYIDILERRGTWRILERRLVVDMSRTDAVPDFAPLPRDPDGTRDRTDLSYAMLGKVGSR